MEADWKSDAYVAHYNDMYATPSAEFSALADRLDLTPEDIVIDFGCGNGQFLECCAKRECSGIGVDGSGDQVAAARERLQPYPRMRVVQSEFLTFDPAGTSLTKGFSRKALHHLSDSQKRDFFRRMGGAFRTGALFLLEDGIFFDFERADLESHWEELQREASSFYGPMWKEKKRDVEECWRLEFPTGIGAWVNAFRAGGFSVIERRRYSGFLGSLLARKD